MKYGNDEHGFVLVTALIIMVVLTIIGIAATRNTSLELQIAGNDKVHNTTFYGAEGGAILGTEILEQNINCSTGFASDTIETNFKIPNALDFHLNPVPAASDLNDLVLIDSNADIAFPLKYNETATPDVFIKIGGGSRVQPGGSLQMAAGYEGVGKSAAGGGVARVYDIYSRHQGPRNSQSIIAMSWRHMIGSESTCNY
ncbi:MAG: PilX N-terminal domain-containing pilus assembly protein [Desulfopila sp.]